MKEHAKILFRPLIKIEAEHAAEVLGITLEKADQLLSRPDTFELLKTAGVRATPGIGTASVSAGTWLSVTGVWPYPPQAFSSADGTIQGVMNGVNPEFIIGCWMRRAQVWRNGQLMTLNVDCCVGGQKIMFMGSQVPQSGDIIMVEAWL
jgi:hypothetical protein